MKIFLSEDDFEIKSKIYVQSQPASCFESYIVFSRCLVFSEFVFYRVQIHGNFEKKVMYNFRPKRVGETHCSINHPLHFCDYNAVI
jgi:hypothetical protein